MIEEFGPAVAVLDGMPASPRASGPSGSMLAAARPAQGIGITTMVTTLAHEDETSTVGISSLVDTWLLLRNVESDGERNRLLTVLKSRGTAHFEPGAGVRAHHHGAELIDVYVARGVLTLAARAGTQERGAQQRQVRSSCIAGASCGAVSWRPRPGWPCCRTTGAERAELEQIEARERVRRPTPRRPGRPCAQRWRSGLARRRRAALTGPGAPVRAPGIASPPESWNCGSTDGRSQKRPCDENLQRACERTWRAVSHRDRGPAGEPAPGGRRPDPGVPTLVRKLRAHQENRRRPFRHDRLLIGLQLRPQKATRRDRYRRASVSASPRVNRRAGRGSL